MNNMYVQKQDKQSSGFAAELFEWLEAIAFALAIVVLLFTFVLRIVSVDGDSMKPTLINEDRILVRSLFYTPEDNDIVIIVAPVGDDFNKPLVKRIVAVGGEYIQIIDGVVYVGPNEENMTPREIDGIDLIDAGSYGEAYDLKVPLKVEEGKVFVMGDNRNNSLDSRNPKLGMVDNRYILGKVIFRIYPFDSFGSIKDGGESA